ncbi:winged helix-turn-helix transcriptional regulator [Candidatus Pacearchaeota archaeon]|nr:winged helix-turn-helix transcriptional regulator [Candidatus Pacearchaeota archaeon]
METTKNSPQKILIILLKDFTKSHTITSLAKEIGMSRTGVWKTLKKMETEKLIILFPIGSGKTSIFNIKLNWDNIITLKNLEIFLTKESIKNQRWTHNFAEIEKKVDFLIIYGSILQTPKQANDIDILSVVSNNNNFIDIEKVTAKIQKIQIKKIHALNFTEQELKNELTKPNKALIDAIKKGTVLFGQEKFIKFIKSIK